MGNHVWFLIIRYIPSTRGKNKAYNEKLLYEKGEDMGNLKKETKERIKAELNRLALEIELETDQEKVEQLKKKYDVLSNIVESNWKISPDTMLVVGANLLGIILILNHERLDIISSKALGFVLKGRV